MAGELANFRGPKYGRGGSLQSTSVDTRKKDSTSRCSDESLTSSCLLELNAADIHPPGGPAQMSNFQSIASYNWLNSSEPTIIVPGSPAIWCPPTHSRKLRPDHGEVFIDQNAARYSSFPLEPMFRAIYKLHPQFTMAEIDVVICRNTMAKLFDSITGTPKSFEIDVESIGNAVLFVRKEKNTTERISCFRGYGFTFPEEYTKWDSEVKGSSSHHRIAQYDFAGLKFLLRFQTDGYLVDQAIDAKEARPTAQGDEPKMATLQKLSDSLTLGEPLPVTNQTLTVLPRGREIDQKATIEIKTRAAHKVLDMDSVLPRLWMSQTSNLIAAYHKDGRFDDVQVIDVHNQVKSWEEYNSVNLQKLGALMRLIVSTVQNSPIKECRIKRVEGGDLEMWELGLGHQSALPDDLCLKLRIGSGHLEEGSLAEHYGENAHQSEDEDDFVHADDESDRDYTACSSEDCGYCGHCSY